MIEESYVSFDTAKLLKEAGFDEVCSLFYLSNEGDRCLMHSRNSELDKGHYSCPTQALAERWLREVHRIVVDVAYIPPHVGRDVWQYFVGGMDDMVWPGDYEPSDRKYETYEEAMEVGLQEALKLIKK